MTAMHTHHALLRYYAAHETPSAFERLSAELTALEERIKVHV